MIRFISPVFFRFVAVTISALLSYVSTAQKQITNNQDLLKTITGVPSTLPVNYSSLNANNSANSCITSTFYLRITAAPGEKINIKEVQTLSNGNYLITGNIILPNLEQEGLLCVMNNSGVIIQQQRLRVNNQSTTFYAAKALHNGTILVSGNSHSSTDNVFVINLGSNLIVNWTKLYSVSQQPVKVSIDIMPNSQIIIGSQVGNNIIYSLLDASGNILWNMQTTPIGMDTLVGIGHTEYGNISLVINCTRSGKKVTEIITFDQINGAIISAHTLNSGADEQQFHKVSSYSNRFIITGVTKSASGQFTLAREIMYNSTLTETIHTYSVPLATDFGCTAAHDNAGDAQGYCFPQLGKLVFIRHFATSQTSPEYTRQYNVPSGSSITGLSRSLIDGGYLFGLNSINQDTVILIKTDSVGIISGCGYTNISNNFSEFINTANTPSTAIINTPVIVSSVGNIGQSVSSLNVHTDCNQQYCPPSPTDDTCLSTFYKTLRSNSYADMFVRHHLMNNNTHLVATTRYERVLETNNQLTYGLKLFSERGDFIKGVNVFTNGISTAIATYKADEHHILVLHYSTNNTPATYTFSLINDSLQVVWSKSVQIFSGYNFFSPGTFGAVTRDTEGNFYYVANSPGYFENAKVLIYKLDPNGNEVWLKVYDLQATILNSGCSATATNNSIVIVLEGSGTGSVSARIDKNSGQLLNAYLYNNSVGGATYSRFLQFSGNRIYYNGDSQGSNAALAIFDTTGLLIKMKRFNYSHSHSGSAAVKSGKFYVFCNYFNAGVQKEILIKTDSLLNPIFVKEYGMLRNAGPQGTYVSDNGSIYTGGYFAYGGVNYSYFDPFLRKIDTLGNTGTCTAQIGAPAITDIPITSNPISFTPIIKAFTPGNIPVVLVPDTLGQRIAEVLCSSAASSCNSVHVTGPSVICQLNQPYTYKAQKSIGCTLIPSWDYDPAMAILQSTTDSTATFIFTNVGNTHIAAKINTGCNFYTDSALVQIQNISGSFTLGRDTSLCTGDTLVLRAGGGFSSYLWQDGSTDSNYIVRTPGEYYVTTTNLCGNIYKDTINITEALIPNLYIGKDTSICTGDTLHITAQAGFSSYSWNPAGSVNGSGSQVFIVPTSNTSVWVKALTIQGCVARDTIAVTSISAPLFSLGKDTGFCVTDSLLLNAGPDYTQYLWNTGATSSAIFIKQSGFYWAKATAANGCSTRDSINILPPFNLPKFSLGIDFNLCNNDQRILDPGNFNFYKWQDGKTSRTYTVTSPGVYYVMVTDNNHCSASDTVVMIRSLAAPVNFLKPVDTVCQYSSLSIIPLIDFVSYMWSNGTTQKKLTVTSGGSYSLAATDSTGCIGKDTILVVDKLCFHGVFIPNAFTPNGDQTNDIFKPRVYGIVVQFRIDIFNRYGEPIFTSTDPSRGWDGSYKSMQQPKGAYIWQCSYELAGEKPVYEKGSVLLIR